jgi:hypothetical protein
MLIHYSIASYELLERKLSSEEKEDVYDVFYRVGKRMGLQELPGNYTDWLPVRETHLQEDLQKASIPPIFSNNTKSTSGSCDTKC